MIAFEFRVVASGYVGGALLSARWPGQVCLLIGAMAGASSGTPGPVSLLFTPTVSKSGDGSRTLELRSGMRSPRASASLFAHGSRSGKWDSFTSTPAAATTSTPARRRSLTPSGSGLLSRETPPPPPAGSLMDISPQARGEPAEEALAVASTKFAQAALQHLPHDMSYKGCWVTGAENYKTDPAEARALRYEICVPCKYYLTVGSLILSVQCLD